jgi:hypothetical protein
MKHSVLPCVFLLLLCGCSTDGPLGTQIPEQSGQPKPSNKVLLQPQQLEGEVRFDDGKIAPFGTMVRAYRNGVLVPGAEDETDSGTGHYGFSGAYSDWPTGWYFIQAGPAYRDGDLYEGSRTSYHLYMQVTYDQDITLVQVEVSPSW